MTDKTDREIMQQALEALNYISRRDYDDTPLHDYELEKMRPAMSTLRERLAQPEQEPVACIVKGCRNHRGEGRFIGALCSPCHTFITTGEGKYSQAYRNSQREWQGLTEKEMEKLADTHLVYQLESYEMSGVFDLLRAVEAKLKEKND